ncbi:MAG: IS5 family transposase, partial [Verrucomicrobia bacterium]|nr:IS5 family transposase [Verrucomicrobiota bacterium]
MVTAIWYVLRTGCPWRDVPREFGPWSSVYTRWRRWCDSGLWARMLAVLARGAVGALRHLDCSHIKLHQHGANPPGGQTAQAIGRTKGGLNTKLAAVVDAKGRVVAVSLAPGPRHDLKAIAPLVPALRGKRASATGASMPIRFTPRCATTACGCAFRRAATGAVQCAFIAATTATGITSKTSSGGSNASAGSARATTNSRAR